MISTDNDFREYLLSMERYYKAEHERLGEFKPFAAEPERRMMLLCRNMLEEYDKTHRMMK